jgi:hypothetical protein
MRLCPCALFAKQSQFLNGQIGVTSYSKGEYEKFPLCGAQKTKPIQS